MKKLFNLVCAAILGIVIAGCGETTTHAQRSHWVGTWGCGIQLTELRNLPPAPGLSSNTLRQIVRVSIGGK